MQKLTRIEGVGYKPPLNAEEYQFSRFTKSTTGWVRSKIILSLKREVIHVVFICPCCFISHDKGTILGGESYQCMCGLKFQKFAGSVLIWR